MGFSEDCKLQSNGFDDQLLHVAISDIMSGLSSKDNIFNMHPFPQTSTLTEVTTITSGEDHYRVGSETGSSTRRVVSLLTDYQACSVWTCSLPCMNPPTSLWCGRSSVCYNF